MKIAIIGSRGIAGIDFSDYLPADVTEVVSGGARGVDSEAAAWARARGIPVTEFLPNYAKYGKGAPLVRNHDIVAAADEIYAFWDGKSRGTKYTIQKAKAAGKRVHIFRLKQERKPANETDV